MQYSFVAVLALAAGAMAGGKGNVTWVTTTVDTFTTVCPEATSLTFNGQTYTATAVREAISHNTARWRCNISRCSRIWGDAQNDDLALYEKCIS